MIILGWIINYNNNIDNNNKECIWGLNKKKEGLLFNGCFDIWHIYHILLWILLGILMPKYYKLAICMSILWEIFEHLIFSNITQFNCNSFICGRIEDPFINLFSYIIGNIISTYI